MRRTITLMAMTAAMCLASLVSAVSIASQPLRVDSFSKIDRSQSEYTLSGNFDFVAVVQARYAIVWTRQELTAPQQNALEAYIKKADSSTEKRTFEFTTENPFESSQGEQPGSYLIQGNRLIADKGRISHLDYGTYTLLGATPTPEPTPELTGSPAPALTPDSGGSFEPTGSSEPEAGASPSATATLAPEPTLPLPEHSASPEPGGSPPAARPTGSPEASPTQLPQGAGPAASPTPGPGSTAAPGAPATGDMASVLIPGILGLIGIALTFVSLRTERNK